MRILVLGSGGREHALAWKLAQSSLVQALFIAPGNAGTQSLTLANGNKAQNIALSPNHFPSVKEALIQHRVDMMVVGPEAPLVKGITDYCREQEELKDLLVVGPDKKGALLEGSKDYAKQFMNTYGIPTASSCTFTADQYNQASQYLETLQPPYVLKADGLAAGKGVIIEPDRKTAGKSLKEMMSGKFGEAGDKVVIESFLEGIEVSVFILTDGVHYKILPNAKDYKRIGHGNTGLNTGGMGAVSPVPFADALFMKKVEERIIRPTLKGLQAEGCLYKGFLFFGLMNCNGDPHVIEYNVRMGDPETQSVMMCLQGDLAAACMSLQTGTLQNTDLTTGTDHCVTVVAAMEGYPGSYTKGHLIEGLYKVKKAEVFHMGTAEASSGRAEASSSRVVTSGRRVVTSGGRVLAVSAVGSGLVEARERAYEQLLQVKFEGMYYREDIGCDLIQEYDLIPEEKSML
ncbi:MAG: phosphoribosylamine--glycine ligase [Bacteroidales bacterium]|nr:phosphoribosylamine--glycine ligase [Bacteroidales bacterium]